MRLVSYILDGRPRPGIQLGGVVVDTCEACRAAGWPEADIDELGSNRDVIRHPLERLQALESHARARLELLRAKGAVHVLSSVRLGPPIPDPDKLICIGLNYHDHAKEVGATPPAAPIFFAKFRNSLAGPADDIVPPRDTNKVDYEAELAVVIGKAGRYISEANALSHVAGAMPFNDVSARDLQLANQLWTGGKAIDTFGPCGPALVLADEMGDIQNLRIWTRVDGQRLQDGSTASMIFGVAKLIAFLSRIMTLEPGDIIATGTPAGVAGSHRPPRFLRTGQLVEVGIEGLGETANRVAEPV